MIFESKKSTIQFLNTYHGVDIYIKREDQLHDQISGNKFRKLKYNILKAEEQQKDTLLTFGGAFSNHIAATACAGRLHGFKTIGVIRGEELGKDLSSTLKQNATLDLAHQNGMQFEFISREDYRNKTGANLLDRLKSKYGDFYTIPEGGTNELAVKGCEEILNFDDAKFDYICVAVGTGGTISGIINSANSDQKVLGFPALQGDFLKNEIKQYVTKDTQWDLINNYHFGGYAKIKEELVTFINRFKEEYAIALDPIYTGKMAFGVFDLIKKGYFAEQSKVLMIHTGGLQGIEGMNKRLQNKGLYIN